MMKKDIFIMCVGVNPAYDITLSIQSPHVSDDGKALVCGEVYRTADESVHAAGKALNVCRALDRLISDRAYTLAYICMLGEGNRQGYCDELERSGIEYRAVICSGNIRENLTVLADGMEKEIKINRKGFSVTKQDSDDMKSLIIQQLKEHSDEEVIAVFSGSMPKNMSSGDYSALMRAAVDAGAKLAVDTEALSLEQLEELRPWLYKPNEAELCRLYGIDIQNEITDSRFYDMLTQKAIELNANGIENVLLTLGAKGLVLVNGEGVHHVNASERRLRNTTGAGDRSLAGFIAGYCAGEKSVICARSAMRAGENETLVLV